jgi:hypothetical protein
MGRGQRVVVGVESHVGRPPHASLAAFHGLMGGVG